jgi:hypothetical protein
MTTEKVSEYMLESLREGMEDRISGLSIHNA